MVEVKHKKTRAIVFRHTGDLAGANLQRADLRYGRLRDAELMSADLFDAALCHADLRRANMTDARLDRADLSGANLEKANLRGACLRGARLTGTRLPRNIAKADFSGADLRGFRGLRTDTTNGNGFQRCTFDGADLRGTDLRGLVFADCSFKGADLRGVRMNGANQSRLLTLGGLAALPKVVEVFAGFGDSHSPSVSALRHSGSFWGWVFWVMGIAGITLPLYCGLVQPATSFERCDLSKAVHDETTRWPKGFALKRLEL